jgi:hypothetical protein
MFFFPIALAIRQYYKYNITETVRFTKNLNHCHSQTWYMLSNSTDFIFRLFSLRFLFLFLVVPKNRFTYSRVSSQDSLAKDQAKGRPNIM